MNESAVQSFLKGLQAAVGQVHLYPVSHPNSQAALSRGVRMAGELSGDEESTLTLRGYAFYLNGTLLAYTSLMFARLYQDLSDRGVESITLSGPPNQDDYVQLVRFLAGSQEAFSSNGSIRINEARLASSEDDSAFSNLRFSYTGVVGTLRNLDHRVARDGIFEMAPVMEAVDQLIHSALGSSDASLLLSTVKSHDEYTFYHSVNTCLMAVATGHYLGLTHRDLVPIGVGAILHDIGKVAISPQVLNYPGRLSRDQWKEITVHPQEGAQAILNAGGSEVAATIALEHHARFDGLGYPSMARMKTPALVSRLVAVADVYDAVTTRRAYRRAETPHRALQILLQGAGGAFDPDMVKSFISLMGIFPPGSVLRLLTGELVVISHTGEYDSDVLQGVLVRDPNGVDVDPDPLEFTLDKIAQQVLAESVGVEPAALLEKAGVAERLLATSTPDMEDGALERFGVSEAALKEQAVRSLSSIGDAGPDGDDLRR